NKKIYTLLPLLLAVTLLFTGCGVSASTPLAPSTASLSSVANGEPAGKGPLTLHFWHSMSGNNLTVLQGIIDTYNNSQSQYLIEAENQGTYDESTGKFFNMQGGDGSAQIIQIGEQNLQSMIDSGLVESVSELISDYSYNQSDLLEQAVNFYTCDKTLYAMPFNCSSPVVYYNADALANAGYTKCPNTFEELLAAAPAIAEKNPGMTAVGLYAYGYALDQMTTNMNGYTVNQENGRTGRATEVSYHDQILPIFNWIAALRDSGNLLNFGTSGTDTVSAFAQGDISLFISTSGLAKNVIDSSPFNVGVTPLPVSQGMEAQGVYAGGGALCVAKGLPKETQAGVMDFLTYATSPEIQGLWAAGTGYFPINKKAYETESLTAVYQKLPQLKVAADQLLNSKLSSVTAGPLLSQLPQLRTDLQTAEEAVFNGEAPETAIKAAMDSTNSAIASANQGTR
ncbi:MAG: ABC transporter substrate-binding protein, partial [Oscillospiraceae bacterium]